MILHVVLFRPRSDITEADRAGFLAAMTRARAVIPGIQRFRVGRRITHRRDYELAMKEDFPFAAIIEFDDLDALQAYLRHPAHEELGAWFSRTQDASLVYDYVVEDVLMKN